MMKAIRAPKIFLAVLVWAMAVTTPFVHAAEPLRSWNEGASKKSIVEFVRKVTKHGSPEFVPVVDRIAVFDNDGTLWAEQPLYFQFLFAIDRVKVLAPQHPEWQGKEPFKSLLAGNLKNALVGGEPALLEIIAATHAGMTTDEFNKIVKDWVATAVHPTTKRPYTQMTYQPMMEVARIPARARVQDVHRLRRRGRVHARVCGRNLWHPARPSHWQHRQDVVRATQWRAGSSEVARD